MHVDSRKRILSREEETLLDQIDEILAGKAGTVDEPTGLNSLCARLAGTVPEADPVFRRQLEGRVLEAARRRTSGPSADLPRFRFRQFLTPVPVRSVLAAGLMAALLFGVFMVDPSAHAWADANVTQLMIQLGLRRSPMNVEKPSGPEWATVREGLTQPQAQVLLGFLPKLPGYLPMGYGEPSTFTVYPTPRMAWWRTVRWSAPWFSADRISLEQTPAGQDTGGPAGIGDMQPSAVSVAGAPALWLQLPDTIALDNGGAQTVDRYKNGLIWEHAGVRYTLSVPLSMQFDEARRIAESLR